jgi:hypothetical protein
MSNLVVSIQSRRNRRLTPYPLGECLLSDRLHKGWVWRWHEQCDAAGKMRGPRVADKVTNLEGKAILIARPDELCLTNPPWADVWSERLFGQADAK